ncbi:MAG: DNA adenine methylase [Gammaproteobacteria bacterium]|nr:DNA adenine methylase [Gammaproteobacteria bacterium]
MVGARKLPHSTKSPLRYPGGKYFAVDTIREFIPSDTKTLVSPFLGGGSVELSCAASGIKVYGSDAFEPLMNFWKFAKSDPVLLSERVRVYHPLSKDKFYSLQKGYFEIDNKIEQAAVFFVLNRSSFSGTTLSGGMSPKHPRFTESSIESLRDFRSRNLNTRCCDYTETLNKHSDKLAYLDPPYANGERLYGNKGDMHDFDHERLHSVLSERDSWILSYNDDPRIRSMYNSYRIETPEWSYSMSNGTKSKEILILNM